MAKPYKSVLEAYNESLKRRLPTAEEEAIEPVYPEEYLVGGPGKAVASGFGSSAKKEAAKAARERIANVKIGSKARDIEADKATAEAFSKTKWGQATNEALKKQAEQTAKARAVNKIVDTVEQSADRATRNFFGDTGNAIGNEVYRQNAAGDTYKKGGMTASRRGDGIAARGKTKGRFV